MLLHKKLLLVALDVICIASRDWLAKTSLMMTSVRVTEPQKLVMEKRLAILNEKSMQFTRPTPAFEASDPGILVHYFKVEIGVQVTKRGEGEDIAKPLKFYRLSNDNDSISLASMAA